MHTDEDYEYGFVRYEGHQTMKTSGTVIALMIIILGLILVNTLINNSQNREIRALKARITALEAKGK